MTAGGFGPGVGLVVVDVQYDFADPAGSLSVAGGDAVVAVDVLPGDGDRALDELAHAGVVLA